MQQAAGYKYEPVSKTPILVLGLFYLSGTVYKSILSKNVVVYKNMVINGKYMAHAEY